MRSYVLACLFLVVPTTAFAGDGVLEINQTCAVNTGCFAGDTAGLPVTISASGSYRLTSNLVVPDQNTDGIVVGADDVGIDLNNFVIEGPVVCSGIPVVCTPASGTGSGVWTPSATLRFGTSVRNGSIRGMGRWGVFLGRQSEVTNLRVRSNGLSGISANTGSIVSGNAAYLNGSFGIDASGPSTVLGNAAFQNGDDGIHGGNGSTVSDNMASSNGGDGIEAERGVTVKGNTVGFNNGFGLRLTSSESGYRENVISGNALGTVTGGVDLGNNACNGSTTCP